MGSGKGRSRHNAIPGFDSEEAASLWRVARVLVLGLVAVTIVICIVLIIVMERYMGTFFIWIGLLSGWLLYWVLLRQTKMIQQDMDRHDVLAAGIKLKKGRMMGVGAFLILLAALVVLAAVIALY